MTSSSTEACAEFPRLENAPILEAIVALHCSSSAELDLHGIESQAVARFGADYPRVEQLVQAEATLTLPVEGEPDSRIRHRVSGFRLLDQTPPGPLSKVFHFAPEVFSFNKLRPYSSFDDFQETIASGWEFYRKHFRPEVVERISLRFINRIELPLDDGEVDLRDYLKTMPKLPDSTSQRFVGFFQTLRYECIDTGYFAQVSFATQEPKDGRCPLVMDIECFAQVAQKPQAYGTYAEIVNHLRRLKNQNFYDNLTDTCLKLFR